MNEVHYDLLPIAMNHSWIPIHKLKVRMTSRNNLSQEWIQQYVATQAKRIMDMHPKQTIKETAYELGFPDTANFCRYFKRATGIYPQEYKKRIYPKTQD